MLRCLCHRAVLCLMTRRMKGLEPGHLISSKIMLYPFQRLVSLRLIALKLSLSRSLSFKVLRSSEVSFLPPADKFLRCFALQLPKPALAGARADPQGCPAHQEKLGMGNFLEALGTDPKTRLQTLWKAWDGLLLPHPGTYLGVFGLGGVKQCTFSKG